MPAEFVDLTASNPSSRSRAVPNNDVTPFTPDLQIAINSTSLDLFRETLRAVSIMLLGGGRIVSRLFSRRRDANLRSSVTTGQICFAIGKAQWQGKKSPR